MNILAETSIDQRKAKKGFRKHALLKAKVIETKSITIQKKDYRLIGQQLISSPLFSHFEVVDAEGIRANNSIEEKVYGYISMLQIINHFRQIKPWLEKQSNQAANNNESELAPIKEPLGQFVENIVQESHEILRLFNELDEKADGLFKDPDWTDKQFIELSLLWNVFWLKYEERLKQLFEFHTYILANQLIKEIEKASIRSVYKEAHFNVHLFKETIPLHTPFIINMNDFITLNGQLGKRTDSSERQKLIQKKERFSFHFFKSMLYALLFIQIVVSLLTALGVLHIFSVITTFVLVLLIFYFGYVNDRELLKTIETRFKTYRREQLPSVPLIQKKYKKQFTTYIQTEKRRKRNEKSYEFYVSIAKVPGWFIFFGISIVLLGLAFFTIDNGPKSFSLVYLIVGALLTVFGIYLPVVKLGRRKIVLGPEKLTIQKKTYVAEEITKIRVNNSQTKLFLYVTSIPDSLKYNIEKNKGNEIQAHIFKWCEQNYVTYEVKG